MKEKPPYRFPEGTKPPERACDVDGRYAFRFSEFERACLFADTGRRFVGDDPAKVHEQAEILRREYPESAFDGRLEFLEAGVFHYVANQDHVYYLTLLEAKAKELGIEVSDLTPEQARQVYLSNPKRQHMERYDGWACQLYKISGRRQWSSEYHSDINAQWLYQDVLYRHWAMLGNRPDALDAIESKSRSLIASANVSSGIRCEMQIQYLLRHWAREVGLSHVFSIEHGLPMEDVGKAKQDIRLMIGGDVVSFDIKSENRSLRYHDETRGDHQSFMREKIKVQTTVMAYVLVEDVQEAYALSFAKKDGEDLKKYNRLKKKILDDLLVECNEKQSRVIELLRKKKQPAKEGRGGFSMTKILAQQVRPEVLAALGLLDAGPRTAQSLGAARERLVEVWPLIRGVYPDKESLKDPQRADLHTAARENIEKNR